jgi:hypothetical protein
MRALILALVVALMLAIAGPVAAEPTPSKGACTVFVDVPGESENAGDSSTVATNLERACLKQTANRADK